MRRLHVLTSLATAVAALTLTAAQAQAGTPSARQTVQMHADSLIVAPVVAQPRQAIAIEMRVTRIDRATGRSTISTSPVVTALDGYPVTIQMGESFAGDSTSTALTLTPHYLPDQQVQFIIQGVSNLGSTAGHQRDQVIIVVTGHAIPST